MTATYNLATIAATPKDQVRLLIGDTDVSTAPSGVSNAMMQDEEISFLLTKFNSVYNVAANVCRALAAKFSRLADHTQGDLKTSHSQKAKAYLSMAAQYANLAKSAGAQPPYSGGISLADKRTQEADTDRNPPPFAVGQDDNLIMPVSPNDTDQTLTGNSGS